MKFESLLITDTAGKKSLTATAFMLGFIVVNLKLLLSGATIGWFTMSAFTGSDYSVALAALGAIYVMRRKMGDASAAPSESKEE